MTSSGRYVKPGLVRSENLATKPGKVVKLPHKFEDEQERQKWRQRMQDTYQPKIIDLFCGAGGMSEGFINKGFIVAAAIDHDKDACNTFASNIAANVICSDIAKVDITDNIVVDFPGTQIDVVVGGPPCQGFSIGGQARIRSLHETNRQVLLARNELYQQYFRFVEQFRPAFFVMENVPTLLSFENGAYIKGIEKECDRLGYTFRPYIMDAADYGVPQVRRRLIIIGSRVGTLFKEPRTIPKNHIVPLKDAIGDLPEVLPPSFEECLPYDKSKAVSIYQKLMRSRVRMNDRDCIYDHIVRPVRDDDREIFSHMKPGQRYIDIEERYRRYNSKTFIDKYYMLKPDAPGITITAHLSKDGYRYIHWDSAQHRTISVREAARIQSFGDHYRFTGSRSARFRQIGNAVPPLLAEAIAEQVHLALKREKGIVDLPIQWGLPGYEHFSKIAGSIE